MPDVEIIQSATAGFGREVLKSHLSPLSQLWLIRHKRVFRTKAANPKAEGHKEKGLALPMYRFRPEPC